MIRVHSELIIPSLIQIFFFIVIVDTEDTTFWNLSRWLKLDVFPTFLPFPPSRVYLFLTFSLFILP